MTNHGDFSPEAREHAERTIEVSAVFADNADFLVEKLDDVPDGHVLIAVVNADDEISGLHHVEQTDLVDARPGARADRRAARWCSRPARAPRTSAAAPTTWPRPRSAAPSSSTGSPPAAANSGSAYQGLETPRHSEPTIARR